MIKKILSAVLLLAASTGVSALGANEFAVYPEHGSDSIQDILEVLDYGYDILEGADMQTLSALESYTAVFINCGGYHEVSGDDHKLSTSVINALQGYVSGGGALYTSDFAYVFVDQAFPGNITFYGEGEDREFNGGPQVDWEEVMTLIQTLQETDEADWGDIDWGGVDGIENPDFAADFVDAVLNDDTGAWADINYADVWDVADVINSEADLSQTEWFNYEWETLDWGSAGIDYEETAEPIITAVGSTAYFVLYDNGECIEGGGAHIGVVMYSTAAVTDQGLRNFMGRDEVLIYYDLGGWVPIKSISQNVTGYLTGIEPTDVEYIYNKPLAAGFSYGNGRVIYTTFHNRPASEEGVVTEDAQKFLEYMIIIPATTELSNNLKNETSGKGYDTDAMEAAGMVNQGGVSTMTYTNNNEGADLVFGLNWGGSELKLDVYDPDNNLVASTQSITRPLTVEVEEAAAGDWSYTVTGVSVPHDNYPFTSLAAARLKPAVAEPDTGEVKMVGGASGYVNPAAGEQLQINFTPSSSGDVKVRIYTLRGSLVWEHVKRGVTGADNILWDCVNESGSQVASGVYIVHIDGPGIDTVKRVAIVK